MQCVAYTPHNIHNSRDSGSWTTSSLRERDGNVLFIYLSKLCVSDTTNERLHTCMGFSYTQHFIPLKKKCQLGDQSVGQRSQRKRYCFSIFGCTFMSLHLKNIAHKVKSTHRTASVGSRLLTHGEKLPNVISKGKDSNTQCWSNHPWGFTSRRVLWLRLHYVNKRHHSQLLKRL